MAGNRVSRKQTAVANGLPKRMKFEQFGDSGPTANTDKELGRVLNRLVGNTSGENDFWAQVGVNSGQSKVRSYAYDNYGCDMAFEYTPAQEFKWLYNFDGLSRRIVNTFPDACWEQWPHVRDGEGTVTTPWEKEWNALCGDIQMDIPGQIRLLDRLTGIGHWGVMYFGLDDGKEPYEPVESLTNKLMYVRAFDESMAKVITWDFDPHSPRYGQPLNYVLTFRTAQGGQQSFTCHWSRCLHVCENRVDSPINGTPRLEPILLRVLQIGMILSGSAHMYMRGGYPGYAIEVDSNQPMPPPEVMMETKRELLQLYHGFARWIAMRAGKIKTLEVQLKEPAEYLIAQYQAISAYTEIPMRVLLGSELAQLASEQDAANFERRVEARRAGQCACGILNPFILKLAELGVTIPPAGDVEVDWHGQSSDERMEEAQIALIKMQILAGYCAPGSMIPQLIPEDKFFEMFMGMEPKEVQALMNAMGFSISGMMPEPVAPVIPNTPDADVPKQVRKAVETKASTPGVIGKPAEKARAVGKQKAMEVEKAKRVKP